MSEDPSAFRYPRELSARESAWLDWLLPADRPGYHGFRERVRPLFVLGEGRWGRHDYVLGTIGQAIDLTAGMRPVMAVGHLEGSPCAVTLTIHEADDEGRVEWQIAPHGRGDVPEEFRELSRWTFSTWNPGDACPAEGAAVREIALPIARGAALTLVIAPARRVVWLHDAAARTNTLLPASAYYNELMLVEGVRDPARVFDHHALFRDPGAFSARALARAFIAYNIRYRKVPLEAFSAAAPRRASWWRRLRDRHAP